MERIREMLDWIKSKFSESQWESIKEVGRWVVFLVTSDIVVQLLNQAIRVPESLVVNVWVFVYTIPARMLFTTSLTLLLRYLDKLKHLNWKVDHPRSEKAGGILPW